MVFVGALTLRWQKLSCEWCETESAPPSPREHKARARTTANTPRLHIAHVSAKANDPGQVCATHTVPYRCFAMKQHSRSKIGVNSLDLGGVWVRDQQPWEWWL